MMGLDTNILVRYIIRDDARQAAAADRLIDSAEDQEEPLFVNHMVLCELLWVLRSAYRLERDRLAEVIGKILGTAAFAVENKDVALEALRDFQAGAADFADCLIGRRNRREGCDATFSFDVRAGALASFRLLETPPTTT